MRRFKKACATIIALTTVLSPLTISNGAVFADTNVSSVSDDVFKDLNQASEYAREAIRGVKDLGFMTGFPGGEFRPYEPITREQVAASLMRALELQPVKGNTGFTDVDPNLTDKDKTNDKPRWSHEAIATIAQSGVMTGDGSHFRPEDHITREELTVVLVRALKMKEVGGLADIKGKGSRLTISDKNQVSSWAKDYVQAAMELGLITGDSTYFRPKELAQRQDVAVMLMNVYKALRTDWAVISTVTGTSIIVNGVTYQIGEEVQGILNIGNREILQNAKISFIADNKKRINKITGLQITASGNAPSYQEFSSNVVLSGNNTRIDGSLIINSDYVTVKNLTVTGDLQVTSAMTHSFYALNTSVQGKLILEGGTRILAENSRLNDIEIRSENAYFEVKGTSTIDDVTVTAKHSTVKSSATIPNLILTSAVEGVELNAPITTLNVKARPQILLSGSMSIGNILLPQGVTLRDILVNYSSATAARIKLVNGQKQSGSTTS